MRNLPGFHKKLTWQPWANTVAYYPLEDDYNDHSWNNRNPSWVWSSVSLVTSTDWYKCTQFVNNSNSYLSFWNQWNVLDVSATWVTFSFWIWDAISNTASWAYPNWIIQWNSGYNSSFFIALDWGSGSSLKWCLQFCDEYSSIWIQTSEYVYGVTTMNMYTVTISAWWECNIYKNDNSTPIWSQTKTLSSTNRFSNCYIWVNTYDSNTARRLNWKLRQIVIEKWVWAQEDRDLYYKTFIVK